MALLPPIPIVAPASRQASGIPGVPALSGSISAQPAIPSMLTKSTVTRPAAPMIPVAAATAGLKPANPFGAMAQGLIQGLGAQQEQAQAEAAEQEARETRREAGRAILDEFPDQVGLARQVMLGAVDPDKAWAAAYEIADKASTQAETEAEKANTINWLRENGHEREAEMYANNVMDIDGVANSLKGAPVKDAPSGYQRSQDGTSLEPIPGGPADKSSETGLRDLSAGEKTELFEAQDAVRAGEYVVNSLERALELSPLAREGFGAETYANIGANIPDVGPFNSDETDHATIELKNITTEMALNQLKTVFGGMPTEGERKILLELQGSAGQPRAVREEIYKRALEMARRRIEDQRAKATGIQTGDYLRPADQIAPNATAASPSSGDVPAGVDPADWNFMSPEQRELFK